MKRLCYIAFAVTVLLQYTFAVPVDPASKKTILLQDGRAIETEVIGDENGYYFYDAIEGNYFEWLTMENVYKPIQKKEIENRIQQSKLMKQKQAIPNRLQPFGICGYSGKKRGLLILVEFNDVQFDSNHDVHYYDRIINTLNLQDTKFAGSVKDYFLEQSNGQLELDFDIVGPVRMPQKHTYYGMDITENGATQKLDVLLGEMVVTACQELAEGVDFSKYDWDGDGEVEQLGFIYSGVAQSSTHNVDDIWPQKRTLSDSCSFSLNNVMIKRFFCSSEYRTSSKESGIGTFCHEFSHCMGLPDTYNSVDHKLGTQKWDLMGDGCHNENGFVPAGFTSLDKMLCGWIRPIELQNDTLVSRLEPLNIGGDAYIISNKAYPQEFFLIENRQKIGFDRALPDCGMLIYHIDYDHYYFSKNVVNKLEKGNEEERCKIIVANGGLDKNREGCCYPTNSNNCFTNNSTPAATLYHQNIDGKYYLGKPIKDIAMNGLNITFSFQNDIGDQDFRLSHNIHIDNPGTLSSFIPENDIFGIDRLKISGTINSSDIIVLRKMGGRSETNESTRGIMKELDMEEVSFQIDERPYFIYNSRQSSIANIYSFPDDAMYYTNIEQIILPINISEIGSRSFEFCYQLKDIKMRNNIKTIRREAFYHCSNLTSVTLPESIEDIESYAFGHDYNLLEIKSLAETPPVAHDKTFSDSTYKNATLYVPYGCKETYSQAKGWKLFVNIVEIVPESIETPLGIMGSDNAQMYSSSGIMVDPKAWNRLPKGIYISNGKKLLHQ